MALKFVHCELLCRRARHLPAIHYAFVISLLDFGGAVVFVFVWLRRLLCYLDFVVLGTLRFLRLFGLVNFLGNNSAIFFRGDRSMRGHRQILVRHRCQLFLFSLVLHLFEQALLGFFVALHLLSQIDDYVLLGFQSLLLFEIIFFEIAALAVQFCQLMPQLPNNLHLLGNYFFIFGLLFVVQVFGVLQVELHAVYQILLILYRHFLLLKYQVEIVIALFELELRIVELLMSAIGAI